METERCKSCDEIVEPGYSVCWRCGTHIDGTPPSPDFVPDTTPAAGGSPPNRELNCLRCTGKMVTVRRVKLHEGTRAWPFLLGELGELFVNRESFDVYACSGCGKVEFFMAGEP